MQYPGSVPTSTQTPNRLPTAHRRVEPGHGYFDMTGFALEVEDLLGVFTQVATVNGLKLRIRDRVLAEAVPV